MACISICIPFYSGQSYLKLAIQSVLNQTNQNWELIVVDNCGPEAGTPSMIEAFANQRIQYFKNQTNIGMAGNWNRCLELANHPLVTLLHSDDELEPDYVDVMLKASVEHPLAAAYFCRALVIDESGNPVFSFPDLIKTFVMPSRDKELVLEGQSAVDNLMKGNFIFCPTLCYRKDLISSLRFSQHWNMVLDLEFLLHILTSGNSIVGVPNKSYRYRRHANNATVHLTSAMTRFNEEVEIHRQFAKIFSEKGWVRAAETARKSRVILLHLGYLMLGDILRFRFKNLSRKIQFIREKGLLI